MARQSQLVGRLGPTRRSQLARAGQVLGPFGPMTRLDWGTLALLLATLGLRGNISCDLEAVEPPLVPQGVESNVWSPALPRCFPFGSATTDASPDASMVRRSTAPVPRPPPSPVTQSLMRLFSACARASSQEQDAMSDDENDWSDVRLCPCARTQPCTSGSRGSPPPLLPLHRSLSTKGEASSGGGARTPLSRRCGLSRRGSV